MQTLWRYGRLVPMVAYHFVKRHKGLFRMFGRETRAMLGHLCRLTMVGGRHVQWGGLFVEIYHIPVN
jgi:hypothetical protein